jgi:hypothetical protein
MLPDGTDGQRRALPADGGRKGQGHLTPSVLPVTLDLPGLVNPVKTKGQLECCLTPDLVTLVRGLLHPDSVLRFSPTSPSGETHRRNSKLGLKADIALFHWSGWRSNSPLRAWHREQALSVEARWCHLAAPWMALWLLWRRATPRAASPLPCQPYGPPQGQNRPRRSRIPRPSL